MRYRSDSPLMGKRRLVACEKWNLPLSDKRRDGASPFNERNSQMATKTKAIEVKVDERLAEAISDKAVKSWHATNYSNGKKRVYVTFEEVVSA